MGTVLVIEDTQDNFDLIEDALDGVCEVVHADTGQEGLDAARKRRPDLILLDMGLPAMNGWDVVRIIRSDAQLRDIPVVALTAHAMSGDRERCLDAGCDDYMAKPIEVKLLLEMVARYIDAEESSSASTVIQGIPSADGPAS